MDKDYTRIMSKGKPNFFDILKQALAIPARNKKFIIFTILTSIPFLCFLVFFEIVLQGLILETSSYLERSYNYSHDYWLWGQPERPTMMNLFPRLVQISLLYLIPYHLLEFLSIAIIVTTAKMVYAAEKPVGFRDMMAFKVRLNGPFTTSSFVHLLSASSVLLTSACFILNCCIMVRSIQNLMYIDILLTIVRGVGFTALLVKFLEWSAGWNLAIVMSLLEEKHGIEALELSTYISKNFRQRGLMLMFIFFAWGFTFRLSWILHGFNDEFATASVLFTCVYTSLICLGNAMKWVVCAVYFFDCKKEIFENEVDVEGGRVVQIVNV